MAFIRFSEETADPPPHLRISCHSLVPFKPSHELPCVHSVCSQSTLRMASPSLGEKNRSLAHDDPRRRSSAPLPHFRLEASHSDRWCFPLCIYVTNTDLLQTGSGRHGRAWLPLVGTAFGQVRVHRLQQAASCLPIQGLCFRQQLRHPGASGLGLAGAASATWWRLPCRWAPAGTRQGRLSTSDAHRGLPAVAFPPRLGA